MSESRLTPHLLDLIQQAALTSFWRKRALTRFLAQSGVPENHIATMEDETKRDYLERLWSWLSKQTFAEAVFMRVAQNLMEQTSFPDLMTWEDSSIKLERAKNALKELRDYIAKQESEIAAARKTNAELTNRAEEAKKRSASRRLFDGLKTRFNELGTRIGTQTAGYDFEEWFFDLIDFYEIHAKRPYKHDGRQIDGSITLGDTTYLMELKFTAGACDAPEVDTFLRKVTTKADNTMGIMVSMSGYTSPAIKEASGARTPLLLMDYSHVLKLLSEELTFRELVQRLRSHASQTGEAFLATKNFG